MTLSERNKLTVYIAGSGRSGSTLLDLLLNNSPLVQSLGEVHRLNNAARLQDELCTCGQPVTECSFWLNVEELAKRELDLRGDVELLKYKEMMLRKEDLGFISTIFQKLLLLLGNKGLYDSWSRHFGIAHRRAVLNSLFWFDMVRKATGSPVIVDSTKDARRLKALYLTSPNTFKVIFLVRDGRAVTASAMRRTNESMRAVAREWVRWNKVTLAAMKTIPDSNIVTIRYEDLCAYPDKILRQICEFISIPYDYALLQLNKDIAHNIGGNPMRFRKDEIEIKLDEQWRNQLSDPDLETFYSIGGNLNKQFGYT